MGKFYIKTRRNHPLCYILFRVYGDHADQTAEIWPFQVFLGVDLPSHYRTFSDSLRHGHYWRWHLLYQTSGLNRCSPQLAQILLLPSSFRSHSILNSYDYRDVHRHGRLFIHLIHHFLCLFQCFLLIRVKLGQWPGKTIRRVRTWRTSNSIPWRIFHWCFFVYVLKRSWRILNWKF